MAVLRLTRPQLRFGSHAVGGSRAPCLLYGAHRLSVPHVAGVYQKRRSPHGRYAYRYLVSARVLSGDRKGLLAIARLRRALFDADGPREPRRTPAPRPGPPRAHRRFARRIRRADCPRLVGYGHIDKCLGRLPRPVGRHSLHCRRGLVLAGHTPSACDLGKRGASHGLLLGGGKTYAVGIPLILSSWGRRLRAGHTCSVPKSPIRIGVFDTIWLFFTSIRTTVGAR